MQLLRLDCRDEHTEAHFDGWYGFPAIHTAYTQLSNRLEPPFYVGLPSTNKYKLRLSAYFSLYRAIIKRPPSGTKRFAVAKKLIARVSGFDITPENWVPFQRSLKHTILKQTALNDIKKLKLLIQIVYGKFDQVVINDKKKLFLGTGASHVTAMEVPGLHGISPRASRVLARLITDAVA